MDEKFGIVRYDRWDHAYYVFCPYCMSKDVLEDKNAAGSHIECRWCNKTYIMPIS